MNNLSSQLKSNRKKYGYSQEKLAELCGVTRQAVAKWENGSSVPDVDNLLILSKLFHISLDLLLTGKESAFTSQVYSSFDANAENEKLINNALRESMRCSSPDEEIQMFIGCIGQMMSCERVYIFGRDPEGNYCNTFEWCNKGVSPEIRILQEIPKKEISSWIRVFQHGEYIYIDDLKNIREKEPDIYKWLEPQGIHTLLAFPLFEGEMFIGVDNPVTAFVSQTAVLMELITHFVESILMRVSIHRRLKMENAKKREIDLKRGGKEFCINLVTGKIFTNLISDYDFEVHQLFEVNSLKDLYDMLENHEECRGQILDALERAKKSKESTAAEFVFYTENHLIRWAKISFHPFTDRSGNVLHIYGSLNDISEEHEIIHQYNAFTTHLHGGMHICYLSDPCHLAYASDNLCSLVGYTREEFDAIVGVNYDSLVVDEDLASFKGFVKRLADHPGSMETCEYGLKHRNGSVVKVVDTMESVLEDNGIVYGYANVMELKDINGILDRLKEDSVNSLIKQNIQYGIVEALSRNYRNVFFVDLNQNQAVVHKLHGYIMEGLNQRSTDPVDYYKYCSRYIQDRVHPEDREKMYRYMHPDTVRQELQETDDYSRVYRVLEEGKIRYCQFKYIVLEHQRTGKERYASVVVAFQVISDKIRKIEEVV